MVVVGLYIMVRDPNHIVIMAAMYVEVIVTLTRHMRMRMTQRRQCKAQAEQETEQVMRAAHHVPV